MQILLLIIWILSLSFYYPLNRRKYYHQLKFKIDNHIPLVPIFVIPYTFFFFWLIIGVYFLWNHPLYLNFIITHILATSISTFIWLIYPTGVKRPILDQTNSVFTKILTIIYHHDHDNNACPSGHVYSSLVTSIFLTLAYPQFGLYFYLVGILISLSTLFTKQHYIIDLLIAALLVIVCTFLSFAIVN